MSTLRADVAERRAAQAAGAAHSVAPVSAATLVVSTWQGETWVLPWAHMTHARTSRATDSEWLELHFPQLLVTVRGYGLRALLEPLSAFRLSFLRDFPADYRPSAESGEPFISRIEVRPLSAGEIRESSS